MIGRRAFLVSGAGATALAAVGAKSALADARAGVAWDPLRRRLAGQLVLPSDPAYETAKQLDLMQFDVTNPQAVAYCANPADVSLCLRFAQDNGVPFAARSGGHSTGGYSTSEGLVIDVSRLNSVFVGEGTVSIGPGAQMVDITNTLAASGLAISGGFYPTVAAGGYLHGGGLGSLIRHVGIASDKVTAARVVLASGRVVTASARENPDLYWAVRGGGGGNFGIVVATDLTPTAVGQAAVANLAWSYDHAVDVLDGYARWLADAPRTLGGAAIVMLRDAAVGATPAPMVLIVSVGTTAELASEVGRLVSLTGPPAAQFTDVMPYQAVMTGLYRCSTYTVAQCHRIGASPQGILPRSAFGLQRSRLFSEPMPRSGWEQALAVFDTGRLAGQAHVLEVLALGGAANDLDRTTTAYVHRDSLFSTNYQAQIAEPPVSEAAAATARQWVDAGFAVIDPYSNGETYQNFTDPALADWRESYYAENYPRLARIKARYDPDRAFEFAQSIT